jgi:tetratricopeptide (TPR) repeat protein
MTNPDPLQENGPIAYKLSEFVGREQEKDIIRESLRKGAKVIYLSGEGGIGKTRLLEELPEIVKPLGLAYKIFNVIDFYNTSNHIGITIEETLLKEIQKDSDNLVEVKEAFEKLDKLRRKEIEESEFHQSFVRAFSAWIEDSWAILCFDTAEFLEYGQDAPEVLSECEVETDVVPAVTWLKSWLPKLDQATAVIASRPSPRLKRQLQKSYPDEEWADVPLDHLSLNETQDYFQKSEYGHAVDHEMVERIWILTDGRPILISLAIDWLVRGIRVDSIYDVDVEQLKKWKEEKAPEWKNRVKDFEKALVIGIRFLDNPIHAALFYAARTRKGFSASIIQELLQSVSRKPFELSDQEVQELMNVLERFSFVKRPYGARPGWLFLHDEMYDLIDEHIWWVDYPMYSHQAQIADFLASKVYGDEDGEGLIAESTERLNEAKTGTESVEIAKLIDVLKTEQLFYQLEAHPKKGYDLYERADTQAISSRNHDWDDMLRIEILRFLRTLSKRALQGNLIDRIEEGGEVVVADHINRGCRARWVHRFFARGQVDKAERIARRMIKLHPDYNAIWQSRILTSLGAALVRKGETEASKHLTQAIDMLEEDDQSWMVQHYKGIAYLYLGLQSRAKGYLSHAAEEYEKAQMIFANNDEPTSNARVLTNLAYVWSRQGEVGDAISAANEAIKIRLRHGDIVGTALSYNTLAIAERRAGAVPMARHHAREALKWLQRAGEMEGLEYRRETAMIHLNLGQITRYLATKNVLRAEGQVEADWRRAEGHLQEAEEFLSSLEPYYRFELFNQFGTLYGWWARWVILYKQESHEFNRLISKSDRYFVQADKVAQAEGDTLSRAENLEDRAWNLHLRYTHLDKTTDDLDAKDIEKKILEILREAEKLSKPLVDVEREGVRANYIAAGIYEQLGQYYQTYKEDFETAFSYYALSVALFDQFSKEYVERRERAMENIQEAWAEFSQEKFSSLAHIMLNTLNEYEIEGEQLRNWIHDALADVNLWIKDQMRR